VSKKYQTKTPDTSALAVPEQVSVAMNEIAADMREGCSPSRSARACR
jgi:hypothetical protein